MGEGPRDVVEKGEGKRQAGAGRLETCGLGMSFYCA